MTQNPKNPTVFDPKPDPTRPITTSRIRIKYFILSLSYFILFGCLWSKSNAWAVDLDEKLLTTFTLSTNTKMSIQNLSLQIKQKYQKLQKKILQNSSSWFPLIYTIGTWQKYTELEKNQHYFQSFLSKLKRKIKFGIGIDKLTVESELKESNQKLRFKKKYIFQKKI
jgi:hypothetical protein